MKAGVYYGAVDMRLEDLEVPEAGPDDVLVEVRSCGICGSDLHAFRQGIFSRPGWVTHTASPTRSTLRSNAQTTRTRACPFGPCVEKADRLTAPDGATGIRTSLTSGVIARRHRASEMPEIIDVPWRSNRRRSERKPQRVRSICT